MKKTAALDDPKEAARRTFGWTLHDVFRLFQRSWNHRLHESGAGISPAQSRALTALYKQDGLTQTELADEVEMEKAPLGRLLDRLEEQGFVERRSDPADRRVRRVYQTEKAKGLEEPMWSVARGMFDSALQGLTPEELTTLLTLLDRLKQNLLTGEKSAVAPGVIFTRPPTSP
ncbi:MAG TPA: MarR family transcriptional regulator [Parvibaculum sp.]